MHVTFLSSTKEFLNILFEALFLALVTILLKQLPAKKPFTGSKNHQLLAEKENPDYYCSFYYYLNYFFPVVNVNINPLKIFSGAVALLS